MPALRGLPELRLSGDGGRLIASVTPHARPAGRLERSAIGGHPIRFPRAVMHNPSHAGTVSALSPFEGFDIMAAEQQKTPMQLEADRRAAAARGDRDAIEAGETGAQQPTVVHTYPDGSQRVGVPPFPEKSPLEEETAEKRQVANGMVIPPGMKVEGEAVVASGVGITAEEFQAKAEQQLQSDITSGKSPSTINPTTASTKPLLAGTDGHVLDAVDAGATGTSAVGDLGNNEAPVDLNAIAAQIEPQGDFEATDEQKEAAVAQVAREVGVPVVDGDKTDKDATAKRGPGRPAKSSK